MKVSEILEITLCMAQHTVEPTIRSKPQAPDFLGRNSWQYLYESRRRMLMTVFHLVGISIIVEAR